MLTINKLRKKFEQLDKFYRSQVKEEIERWLESFITSNTPWRGIANAKHLRPISFRKTWHTRFSFSWPAVSYVVICEELAKLGFIVVNSYDDSNIEHINVLVPQPKKGEKLTFAQEKVKQINNNYSRFVSQERKVAEKLYEHFLIKLLYDVQKDDIKSFGKYVLVKDFYVDTQVGQNEVRLNHFKALMAKDGIEEVCDEFGKLQGIKVFIKASNS